ncbi:murein hydrolase activator EnvC family protein [Psychromonas sp. Urea-02u-13]|uniref:murein hydrolase activator EnvC family protein n=1 Tax=Psychromonas sp. Urea-02u-13 TaxID=2058326 RepID=UPI000C343615|nr:peptidoglycan DD-metalloendopeptidase family protein [Psychromonas sp. Urea-02u-13]PKG37951.1 peptidase M23 [Psychromonas sp. Urea-02u-13]
MNSKIINKNKRKKSISPSILLNSLFLASLIFLPVQNVLAEKNLSTLQKEIKASKSSKTVQSKQQKSLESKIANSEQETATASFKLQQTEEAINLETTRLKDLKDETEQLKIDKEKQQKLLEQQLISAYMAGQNDLVKLLLNQEDLSKIIRAKSYYHYLNKARLESIEQLHTTQLRIEKNKTEQADSLLNLKAMRDTQLESKEQLVSERDKRTKALRELKQDINYQSARLAQLGDAEKQLKKQLKKQKDASAEKALAAAKAKATKQMKPKNETQSFSKISKLKGKLKWPIRGKVLARFGSKRSDQVKWKGISIAANEGEKVRAVATGKVLFAGYFKGYGMVIALDHSDDYITLYGYNQTLLQKTGDIVFQGDAIALAGHSGGQDKNSLYFELSHKGKAQDPLRWLKSRR